jgi:DNA helicase-2/ATP-dependent DNA helicase PcrA
LADFAEDLELVADAVRTGTTRQVLRTIVDLVGLGRALNMLDRSKGGHGESQVDELDALIQVADLHPDPTTFESWLRGVLERRRDRDGIILSTVHRVKGMEWDRVIVAGVSEGVFPHRLAGDREEERRVMHVAITRCRHRVVVLSDSSRPSPFLNELQEPAAPPADRRTRSKRKTATAGAKSHPPGELARQRSPLEEALRTWRRQRSQTDKVAVYLVASDALLKAIAQTRPATLPELARIKGIGPRKLELYGTEILAVVQAAAKDQ